MLDIIAGLRLASRLVCVEGVLRDCGHDAVVACGSGIEYGKRTIIFADWHDGYRTMYIDDVFDVLSYCYVVLGEFERIQFTMSEPSRN